MGPGVLVQEQEAGQTHVPPLDHLQASVDLNVVHQPQNHWSGSVWNIVWSSLGSYDHARQFSINSQNPTISSWRTHNLHLEVHFVSSSSFPLLEWIQTFGLGHGTWVQNWRIVQDWMVCGCFDHGYSSWSCILVE